MEAGTSYRRAVYHVHRDMLQTSGGGVWLWKIDGVSEWRESLVMNLAVEEESICFHLCSTGSVLTHSFNIIIIITTTGINNITVIVNDIIIVIIMTILFIIITRTVQSLPLSASSLSGQYNHYHQLHHHRQDSTICIINFIIIIR